MEDRDLEQEALQMMEYGKPRKPKRNQKPTGFIWGFLIGVMLAVVVCAVIFYMGPIRKLTLSQQNSSAGKDSSEKLLDKETKEKIELLAQYIQKTYYEDVDMETLRNGLFQGLYDNLDIYSQYYSEEDYQSMLKDMLEGIYCGVGVNLQQDQESMIVTIVRVYENTPAQAAGLKAGDIISKVDEYDSTSMELSEIVTRIRGENDTSVHLTIYRNGKQMEFDVVRAELVLPTVTSEMLENKVGYISVSEFSDKTAEQFETSLTELQQQGMDKLIVDLRSNPGGVLTTVCNMLDMILPKGIVVYTEDKAGERSNYYSTDDTSLDIPIVVLVNEYSASASEIFAGAIQDRDAGTILGTTTYGKGVVQSVRGLNDGSAFKLTTHRYFTPGGKCIQGIGIKPDVELEYEFLGGEEDEYSYEFDNQIQKAIEILQQEQ